MATQQFEIKATNTRQWKIIFFHLTILFISYLLLSFLQQDEYKLAIIGLLAINFTLLVLHTRLLVKNLIGRSLTLSVNQRGIYDSSCLANFGYVPWDEVKDVYVSEHSFLGQKNTIIEIKVKNPKKLLAKIPFWKRMILLVDRFQYKCPFVIRTGYMPINATELEGQIRACRPA